MGHIKEPLDVDFTVDSTPLTKEDKKMISEIIAHYKLTGKKLTFKKSKPVIRKKKGHFALQKI